jgi:hypothetical protein
LLFNFDSEYPIRKVQEKVGFDLNGTHQLLVYANDVNLLDNCINTIKKIEALLDSSKEIGLKVNRKVGIHLCLVTTLQDISVM